MEGNLHALRQLRQALAALQAEDRVGWLELVATEVVRLGGGDAVDLLQIALDRALEDHDPGDPREN